MKKLKANKNRTTRTEKTNLNPQAFIPMAQSKQNKSQDKRGINYSLFISILSFGMAAYALFNSKRQFELVNQSYMDISGIKATFTAPDSLLDHPLEENMKRGVGAMNFGFKINNVGNIPLKFDVKVFDLFYDGVKVKGVKESDSKNGIVYPKKDLDFSLSTTPFEKLMSSEDLANKKISTKVVIEYTDLNDNRIKTVDREYEFIVHRYNVEFTLKNVKDKI